MTDDTNPFGTFAPQPVPMFTETDDTKGNKLTPETPAASPKRKSRRSRATPAAPSPASSAKADKPKRKYTRRVGKAPDPVALQAELAAIDKVAAAGAMPATAKASLDTLTLMRSLSEGEYLNVRTVLALGPVSAKRVIEAIWAMLPK